MKQFYKLIIAILAISNSFAQTNITDDSSISGVWDLTGSPYIIEGRATIEAGDALTIEPGVEVLFERSASTSTTAWDFENAFVGALKVEGSLTAKGTAQDSILFSRDGTSGYWGAIIIDQSGSLEMEFCKVEYAKESREVTGITNVVALRGGVAFYQNTNFSYIKNSEICNNRLDGLYSYGVNNFNVEIDYNDIHTNGANGLSIFESDLLIRNNQFYNNATNTTGSVAALKMSNSESFATGNLIYTNNQFGCLISASSNLETHLVNNTIYDHNQGLRIEDDANVEIYNSIIFSNTTNFAVGSALGTINIFNSLTDDANFPTVFNDQGGNILDDDPEFLDAANDDFQLETTSPCIDNGYADTNNLNLLDLDILGNPRVDNGTIDIGAIEYQSPIVFVVTTDESPTTGGVTTGAGSYSENSSVTVEAIANPGYNFIDWTENGNVVSTDSEYTFTLTSNRDLQANFEAIEYNVTLTADPTTGGTTAGDGVFQEGSGVTVVATPENGFAFVNWTENGNEVSTDANYTFNIQSDRNLVANFESTASISEESKVGVNIFPNPSSEVLNIEADRIYEKYVIRSLEGRTVLENTFENKINVSNLKPGVYIIELSSGSTNQRKSFVKD